MIKFYDSLGPNPRIGRMLALEKGIDLELIEVNLVGGENRGEEFLNRNPAGQLPCIELDDGSFLAEVTAMGEYFDEMGKGPSIVGDTPVERARSRMWARRVDYKICEPMANGFRFAEGLDLFKERMRCLPEAAEGLKSIGKDGLEWLEPLLTGSWLSGERFTIGDALLYGCLDFFQSVGQPLPEELGNIKAWFGRVNARPSAEASLHPMAAKAKMRG